MQYTPPKSRLPDPKKFASFGRGERRPAHTPTHIINIKQNWTAARRLATRNTRHKPRQLQPGETHTHHR